MRNNYNLPPKRKIKTHEKQPYQCRPSSHQIKQQRPKIHQPKNYTISITRSTSDPIKASPTATQPPKTLLNNIEEGTRLIVASKELENWWWCWRRGAGDGWQQWKESRWWVVPNRVELWWVVLKRVEPVMGGREELMVDWVVERNMRKRKSEREVVHRDWESSINVKYFTNISSVKYFTQIGLSWLGWLKIFFFWQNILLQNKHCKMWKYFTSKQTKRKRHHIFKTFLNHVHKQWVSKIALKVVFLHKISKILKFCSTNQNCELLCSKLSASLDWCSSNWNWKISIRFLID